MGMKLVFHGGKCCGMKTIFNLGISPSNFSLDVEQIGNGSVPGQDTIGATVRSDLSFFSDEAPKEANLERLKRYIKFVKNHRPNHLIEVIIATTLKDGTREHTDHYSQLPWVEPLKSLGFRNVSSWYNSNSGNWCHAFHLVVGTTNKANNGAPVFN